MLVLGQKWLNNSTYASWMRYKTRKEQNNDVELEAMLLYWLFWYVFPSGSQDNLNSQVFFLTILLVEGETSPRVSLPRVSFFRLDECVKNMVRSVGRYCGETHADIAFLQIFL